MKTDRKTPSSGNRRELLREIQFLSLIISTLIIITVQIASTLIISNSMITDLKKKAIITIDETCDFLKEPLYDVDDVQATQIGKVLLSSGRISGIILKSTASGILIDRPPKVESRIIPTITRTISVNNILVGTISLYFSDTEIAGTRKLLTMIALCMLLAVIIVNLLANRFIIRERMQKPISSIIAGINTIAAGQYDYRIPKTEYSDINLLIDMMNDMASKILTTNRELKESNGLLERRVQERTAKLENSIQELKQAQNLLIESEKLSALGQLSAGIAHELNTPLGAIISSNGTLIDYLDQKQQALIDFIPSLDASQRRLFDKVLEYGMKRSLILEFPVSSIKPGRDFRALLEKDAVPNFAEVADALMEIGIADKYPDFSDILQTEKNITIIAMANNAIIARRVAEIIFVAGKKAAGVIAALRSYLTPDAQGSDQVVDIVRDLENILVLTHNMLKYGVQVRREFTDVRVLGSSDALGQVWINLIRNAAQAMDFKGELILRTEIRGEQALVSVIDSGRGIPSEISDRIFEPFFTTKKHGEGMGLGLDICKRIIEAHNGSITYSSVPGHTEFVVTLPVFNI